VSIEMLEFLSDPSSQFLIGVIITLIAIIVSVVIYFKQKSSKKLSYKVVSNTSILTHEERVKGEFQLSYKAKKVDNVRLILLRIFNSGNVPITSADYEQPISIEFKDSTQVLTAEVIRKRPSNLQAAVTIENRVVTLYPSLLNPADEIGLKILVSKFCNDINVSSRINGITKIDEVKDQQISTILSVALILGLLLWGLGSLVWSMIFQVPLIQTFAYDSVIVFAFCVVATVALLVSSQYRKELNKSFNLLFEERDDFLNEGCNEESDNQKTK